MLQEDKTPNEQLALMRQKLTERFSEEELRTLCFDMGVEYESLPGEGKAGKTREFITYLERRNCVSELVEMCIKRRPDVSWDFTFSTPGKFPAIFPPKIRFFGRDAEIQKCLEALSPAWGARVIAVGGLGGIGKTALVVEIAYRCAEQCMFDTFLFVSAKQTELAANGEQATLHSVPTLGAMFDELALQLGRNTLGLTVADKPRGILDALRTRTATGHQVLLILDNLETLQNEEFAIVNKFVNTLPPMCKAIITSRRWRGDGTINLRLESLKLEETERLIEDEMECDPNLKATLTKAGRKRWQELYDATGGSPLALRWALKLMRDRNLSLGKTLNILRREATTESALYGYVYREALKEMGPDDRRVLWSLAHLPDGASFGRLCAKSNLPQQAVECALERLIAYSLVDVHGGTGADGHYKLHPMTRRLALGEIKETHRPHSWLGLLPHALDLLLPALQQRPVLAYGIPTVLALIGAVIFVTNYPLALSGTPQLFAALQATRTALPTYTAVPTLTPFPIHTLAPQFTSTPLATYTPNPTYTPLPTHTPFPTYTPLPSPTNSPTPSPTNSPTPTPTHSPTPTPTNSPTPTPTHTPFTINDDFSVNRGWAEGGDSNGWSKVINGRYQRGILTAGILSWNTRPDIQVRNVNIRVNVYMVTQTPEEYSGGMFFRYGDGQGYIFGISNRGRFEFKKWVGSQLVPIIDFNTNTAVRTSGVNRLRINAVDSKIELYINDVQVGKASDSDYSVGEFGFYSATFGGGKNAVVEFDDLVIEYLQ